MSRYIDCYSLAKISEILAGADILLTPIFVTFFCMAGESQRQQHTWRLHVEGSTPLLGEVGEYQRGLGEVSCCGLCQAKNFVVANILSPPVFCCRQYFVAANILSMFRFKDDYLLLMILFCLYPDYY